MPFPDNERGLENGTVLKTTGDMPQVNLRDGQMFAVYWDGEYVRACGMTWLIETLTDEINAGFWQLAY